MIARHSRLTVRCLALLLSFGLAVPACLQPDAPDATHAGDARALPGSRGPVDEPTRIGALLAEPPVFHASGIRIATFNVEFLFDGVAPEGQADFPWKGDPAAARTHRDGVAGIIRLLDADVLALQEVETLEVLEAMIEESLADLGYTAHFVPGRDTFTRQNVALLSRLPVEEVGRTDERARVGQSRQDYGVSKNMWARLEVGGTPTTIINVHLLGRASDVRRRDRREAQAHVIRALADREYAAGREVIVLGDFNDFDPDVLDRRSSVPLTRVMAILKDSGPGLQNVLGRVPPERRFTVFWDRDDNGEVDEGDLSAIDHILLPPRFLVALREVVYVHAHDPRHGPDHFPVVATLDL